MSHSGSTRFRTDSRLQQSTGNPASLFSPSIGITSGQETFLEEIRFSQKKFCFPATNKIAGRTVNPLYEPVKEIHMKWFVVGICIAIVVAGGLGAQNVTWSNKSQAPTSVPSAVAKG